VSGEYYNEDEIMAGLETNQKSRHTCDNTGIRCLRKPIDVEMIRKVVQKYTKAPVIPIMPLPRCNSMQKEGQINRKLKKTVQAFTRHESLSSK